MEHAWPAVRQCDLGRWRWSADALNGWKTVGADPYFNQPHTTPPITYIGAGKAASGDQATSIQAVDPPGVLPTDLVILDLFTSGPDTVTVSVPAGWTQVPGSPAKANWGEMWRFVETNPDTATPAPLDWRNAKRLPRRWTRASSPRSLGCCESSHTAALCFRPSRMPSRRS